MKVERTPVVAEASPLIDDIAGRCGGARLRGRKAFEEPRQPIDHPGDLCLLEHRLRTRTDHGSLVRRHGRSRSDTAPQASTASRRASSFGSIDIAADGRRAAPADTNDSAIAQHDATHRQALTSAP